MKKLIMGAMLLTTLVSVCKADDQAVLLQKDDRATFTGYLVTPTKIQSLYNLNIDYQTQQHINQNLNLEITDYQTRIKNYQDQNQELAKRIETSDTGFFSKVGYFILGAAITGLVSYGIYRSK